MIRATLTALAFVPLTALPGLAGAGGAHKGPDPQSCEPVYSVQLRECQALNIYRCAQGGETIVYQELIDPDSETMDAFVTPDGDVLYSVARGTGLGLHRVVDNRDPFSASTLMREGTDLVDQSLEIRLPLYSGVNVVQYSLRTEMRDEVVEIDGHRFARATGYPDLELTPGGVRLTGSTEYYIDLENSIVFEGESVLELLGSREEFPTAPARIIAPGRSGKLPTEPFLDCGKLS